VAEKMTTTMEIMTMTLAAAAEIKMGQLGFDESILDDYELPTGIRTYSTGWYEQRAIHFLKQAVLLELLEKVVCDGCGGRCELHNNTRVGAIQYRYCDSCEYEYELEMERLDAIWQGFD
jgi:hypothetical protein